MSTEKDELEVKEQADGSLHVTDPKDVVEEKDEDDHEDDNEGDEVEAKSGSDVESDDSPADDERPSKTEENRRKRFEKKQRIQDRNERLKSELAARDAMIADLTARVQQQERKTSGTEMAQLDQEIRKSAEAYNYFKNAIANAHGQPDGGKIVADATEKMVLASRRYEDLNRIKQQAVQHQNQPAAIDPVLLNHGKAWMEKHSWYNPNSGDEDSQIALAIDNVLVKEGWNPRTPEYWEELDKRLEKRLPERFKSARQVNNRPRSVVTGSGRETTNSSGNAGYSLSAERVQAIKDSGNWDDPKARAESIRRYRQYDRENANAN